MKLRSKMDVGLRANELPRFLLIFYSSVFFESLNAIYHVHVLSVAEGHFGVGAGMGVGVCAGGFSWFSFLKFLFLLLECF